MSEKSRSGRDAYTFSLGGMSAIASFAAPTAIASDSLNKSWSQRLRRSAEDQPVSEADFPALEDRFDYPVRPRTV